MSDSINTYKATFLLDTRGYEQPVDTIVAKLRDTLTAVQAEVIKVENLGQKSFQRVADRRFPSGTFVQITYKGTSSVAAALREKLRLDKTINRILVQAA